MCVSGAGVTFAGAVLDGAPGDVLAPLGGIVLGLAVGLGIETGILARRRRQLAKHAATAVSLATSGSARSAGLTLWRQLHSAKSEPNSIAWEVLDGEGVIGLEDLRSANSLRRHVGELKRADQAQWRAIALGDQTSVRTAWGDGKVHDLQGLLLVARRLIVGATHSAALSRTAADVLEQPDVLAVAVLLERRAAELTDLVTIIEPRASSHVAAGAVGPLLRFSPGDRDAESHPGAAKAAEPPQWFSYRLLEAAYDSWSAQIELLRLVEPVDDGLAARLRRSLGMKRPDSQPEQQGEQDDRIPLDYHTVGGSFPARTVDVEPTWTACREVAGCRGTKATTYGGSALCLSCWAWRVPGDARSFMLSPPATSTAQHGPSSPSSSNCNALQQKSPAPDSSNARW